MRRERRTTLPPAPQLTDLPFPLWRKGGQGNRDHVAARRQLLACPPTMHFLCTTECFEV